jgi:gamma-D-glutamyl-L-lysine dipeptidyl-peptidase
VAKILTVTKNVINIYTKPDISSEVTSQAVLGDSLTEQERNKDFVHVVCADKYQGWVSAKFTTEDEAYVTANDTDALFVIDLFSKVYAEPDESAELVSRLVISPKVFTVDEPISNLANICLPGGSSSWVRQSSIAKRSAIAQVSNWDKSTEQRAVLIQMFGERVAATAKRLMGVPYFWGGCTPFGIDCSGLTQLSYKIEGVQLLRDSYMQAGDKRFIEVEKGLPFDKANFQAGDLIFFKTGNSNEIGDHGMHVGIACGDGRFIHSSGRERNFGVYIDKCSEPFYLERYMKALRLSSTVELSIENA